MGLLLFDKWTEKSIYQVQVPLTALGAEVTVTRAKVCGHAIGGGITPPI